MNDYVILTDSGCDIAPSLLKEWGVECANLTFRFNDEDKEYENGEMPISAFYQRMRKGGVAKTAAVNAARFEEMFEPYLKEGKDILYIGFSTGLSTTYNSGRIAAEGLRETYPDRTIVTVDSLAASAGQGLLLYLAVEKKKAGATLEENTAYVEDLKLHIAHWFTVDDLVYLKRGGRVSATTAFVGNALGIKPVMHVDNAGKLIPVTKVRGRRTSLAALAAKYSETAMTPDEGTIFISQGDCYADAELLASMIAEKHPVKVQLITDVGTVIGAHSGPGTMALFFVAKER